MAWSRPTKGKDGKYRGSPGRGVAKQKAKTSGGGGGGSSSSSSSSSSGGGSSSSSSSSSQQKTSVAYGGKSKDATPSQIQQAKKTGSDYYIGGTRYSSSGQSYSKPSIAKEKITEVGTTSSGTKIYAKDTGSGKVSLYVSPEDYDKQEIAQLKPNVNVRASTTEEVGTISAEEGKSSYKDAKVFRRDTGGGRVGYYVNIDDYENVKTQLPEPNVKKNQFMIEQELKKQAETVRQQQTEQRQQIAQMQQNKMFGGGEIRAGKPRNVVKEVFSDFGSAFFGAEDTGQKIRSGTPLETVTGTSAIILGIVPFGRGGNALATTGAKAKQVLTPVYQTAKKHPFISSFIGGNLLVWGDKKPFDFLTKTLGDEQTKRVREQPYFMETYSNVNENLEQRQKGFFQNILYNTNIYFGTGKKDAIIEESLKTSAKYGLSEEQRNELILEQQRFYNQRAGLQAGETFFIAENFANLVGGNALAKEFTKTSESVLRKNFFGQYYKRYASKYVGASLVESSVATSSQITATEEQRRKKAFDKLTLNTFNPLSPSTDLTSQYIKSAEVGAVFGTLLSPLEPALATKYPKAKIPVRASMYVSDLGEAGGDLVTSGINKVRKKVFRETIEEPQFFYKGKKGVTKPTDEIFFGTSTRPPKVKVRTPSFSATQQQQTALNPQDYSIATNIPTFDLNTNPILDTNININPKPNIPINPNVNTNININPPINTNVNVPVDVPAFDYQVNEQVTTNINTPVLNQAQNVPINVWNPDIPPLLPFALPIGGSSGRTYKGKSKKYVNELAMGKEILNNLLGGQAINTNNFIGRKATKKQKNNMLNFNNPVFKIIKPINKRPKKRRY